MRADKRLMLILLLLLLDSSRSLDLPAFEELESFTTLEINH
jgi:hypothetical protein